MSWIITSHPNHDILTNKTGREKHVFYKDYTDGKKSRIYTYHCEDGPALIEYFKGGKIESEHWMIDGKYHRIGGPAKREFQKSKGPSSIVCSEMWYENGFIHRIGGPAIVRYFPNSNEIQSQTWFEHGYEYNGTEPSTIRYHPGGNVAEKWWSARLIPPNKSRSLTYRNKRESYDKDGNIITETYMGMLNTNDGSQSHAVYREPIFGDGPSHIEYRIKNIQIPTAIIDSLNQKYKDQMKPFNEFICKTVNGVSWLNIPLKQEMWYEHGVVHRKYAPSFEIRIVGVDHIIPEIMEHIGNNKYIINGKDITQELNEICGKLNIDINEWIKWSEEERFLLRLFMEEM